MNQAKYVVKCKQSLINSLMLFIFYRWFLRRSTHYFFNSTKKVSTDCYQFTQNTVYVPQIISIAIWGTQWVNPMSTSCQFGLDGEIKQSISFKITCTTM